MMKQKIKMLIEFLKKQEPDVDYSNIIELLCQYKKGDFIYPMAIQRACKIDSSTTFKIFELCKKVKLVNTKFVLRCPICNCLGDKYYSSYYAMPKYSNCIHCGKENILHDFEVIYEVV